MGDVACSVSDTVKVEICQAAVAQQLVVVVDTDLGLQFMCS